MIKRFNRPGFEESILHSDDDFEPYGFVSLDLQASGTESPGHIGSSPFVREIEAAVLRRLNTDADC